MLGAAGSATPPHGLLPSSLRVPFAARLVDETHAALLECDDVVFPAVSVQ
jgi:hypothetical protein